MQVYDPMKIQNKNMDEEKVKVRLLICNSNDEILVCNYNGIYMLPGGKLEDNEQQFGKPLKRALVREIKEEIGIDITNVKLEILHTIVHYQEDYPKVNGQIINREVTTHYFKTEMDIDLETIKNNLSEREKEGNFNLEWIKKDKLRDILINSTSKNPRKDFFHDELRIILEEYLHYIDIELIDSNHEKYQKKHAKYIDLHTHSIYSDGDLTPDELLKKASENNIKTISITDHDNILAYENIKECECIKKGLINLIPGIELSAKTNKGRMHILGYGIDINNKELNNKMKELKNNSFYSIIALLNQLKIDYGIVFDSNDIKEIFNKTGNIGRPDLAKLLVKYNLSDTVQAAFDKYLIEAYNKIRSESKGLTFEECIKLIKNAGGISVLAHPNQLQESDEKLEEILKNMIACGLDGIEVYHSTHTKEDEEKFLNLANKYNLLVSGGSDFHGQTVKPDITLGQNKIKSLSMLNKVKRFI